MKTVKLVLGIISLVLCCIVPVSACLVMYLGNFLRILREYDEGRSA